MRASCEILDQASQEQFFLRAFGEDAGDLFLAEQDVCLEAPLAVNKVVTRITVRAFRKRDGDRFLQPELGNVGHDLGKLFLAALAWIEHFDLLDRDHPNVTLVTNGHAATSISRRT